MRVPGTHEAEFAIVIADVWQSRGLGTEMLKQLLSVAGTEGVRIVMGTIASDNTRMQRMAEKLGFTVEQADDVCVARKTIVPKGA